MKHSYASQVLKQKKIKVFCNGKRILDKQYRKSHPQLRTRIEKSTEFKRHYLGSEGIKRIRDYEEVLRLGFKIIKYMASGEAFKYQRVGYSLVRLKYPSKVKQEVLNMPGSHYVEYDTLNLCLRLCGKNVSISQRDEWISLKDTSAPPPAKHSSSLFNVNVHISRAQRNFMKLSPHLTVENSYTIPEGVIGITDEGYIAALPEPKKTDPYFILIFGGRGQGKSLEMSNLEDIFFHKFSLYCANINDIKPEAQSRCLEWEKGDFRTELKRFGEDTIPKPAVYLHPTTKDDYQKLHMNEVGFDISLPFRHLLRDENLITYNKSWKMRESASLIAWRNLIWKEGHLRKEGLIMAASLKHALKVVDDEIQDQGMRDKAYRVLSDVFNTNMIDRSSGISSRWVYQIGDRQFADSAWNVAMKCGLFPYINTSGIRDELWFALWLRYVISDIMEFAYKQLVPTQIFIDEIEALLKEKVTREIIERAIRECRSKKVGITMVNHNYRYLPESIYSHSSGSSGYKFIFNTGEQNLRMQLRKDGLTKSQAEDIPHLKQFQCYAMGKFILYDTDGTSTETDGPIKIIKTKPPNCQHWGG